MRAGVGCAGFGRLRCAATGGGSSGRRGNGDANPYAGRSSGNGDAQLAGHYRRNGGNDRCSYGDTLAHRDTATHYHPTADRHASTDGNPAADTYAPTYCNPATDGNAVSYRYPNAASYSDPMAHANPVADTLANCHAISRGLE